MRLAVGPEGLAAQETPMCRDRSQQVDHLGLLIRQALRELVGDAEPAPCVWERLQLQLECSKLKHGDRTRDNSKRIS